MKGVSAENYYFFDLDYFKNFKDLLGKNQKLLVAKYEGKVISALFLMIHGQYAHIHLSGSIYEYLNLGVNNLIKHEAVNFAKNLGAKYFHFGGGNTSNVEDHLFNFKANFSTERGDFYIGKKVDNQDIYSQLCEKWEKAYPEKKERFSKYLLKYRLTDN
jgi:lipid II:glycine glycyltransferase (peptidoglycan interpeptide bridge formation enzyme)